MSKGLFEESKGPEIHPGPLSNGPKEALEREMKTAAISAAEHAEYRRHQNFDLFDMLSNQSRQLLRDLPADDKLRIYAARILTAAEYGRRHLLDEMTAKERAKRGKK